MLCLLSHPLPARPGLAGPAVMPCRSDKTRSGMARFGHLADGRLKLVLVRKCSPLQVGAHGLHSSLWGAIAQAACL